MKEALRAKFRELRASIAPAVAAAKSQRICQSLLASEAYESASAILFYRPVGNEVDCMPAIRQAFTQGKKVFFPRLKDGRIEPVGVGSWGQVQQMKPGAFGIPEPSGQAAPLRKVDLVVVPGVAFDLQGSRLGYGKGHYDALLARTKAATIGLCYDEQFVGKLPAEKHDRQMDWVITDQKVIRIVKD